SSILVGRGLSRYWTERIFNRRSAPLAERLRFSCLRRCDSLRQIGNRFRGSAYGRDETCGAGCPRIAHGYWHGRRLAWKISRSNARICPARFACKESEQLCFDALRKSFGRFRGRSVRLIYFNSTITTLAPSVFFHRRVQIFFREIRPELGRHIHLRVGKLPKQEVRQSHFAGSANEQIGVRIIARVKMFAEHLNIDHSLVDMAELDRAEQALDSVNNL